MRIGTGGGAETEPIQVPIHTIEVLSNVSENRILSVIAAVANREPQIFKMPTRYSEQQRARDAEYNRKYREWVASLGANERMALAREGLDLPDLASSKMGQTDPNVAIQMHGVRDCLHEATAETESDVGLSRKDDGEVAAAIASFCARIRGHASPLLAFDAACFAAGLMEVEGLSETALARRHRVTRAYFSKAVIMFCDTFGLRPSMGMRSKRARLNHRDARIAHLKEKGGSPSDGSEPL